MAANQIVQINPKADPCYVSIPAASSSVTAFRRTIVQPADGNSFTVTLPTAQADALYKVTATLADATVFVIIAIPTASRTINDFVCETSDLLSDGDSIEFEVVASS